MAEFELTQFVYVSAALNFVGVGASDLNYRFYHTASPFIRKGKWTEDEDKVDPFYKRSLNRKPCIRFVCVCVNVCVDSETCV